MSLLELTLDQLMERYRAASRQFEEAKLAQSELLSAIQTVARAQGVQDRSYGDYRIRTKQTVRPVVSGEELYKIAPQAVKAEDVPEQVIPAHTAYSVDQRALTNLWKAGDDWKAKLAEAVEETTVVSVEKETRKSAVEA